MIFKRGCAALVGAAVALGLASCAPPVEAPEKEEMVVTQVEEEAIEAVRNSEVVALRTGDVKGFLAVFAVDAVVMPPGEPAVVGRQSVQRWFQRFLKLSGFENLTHTTEELVITGDWAFEQWSVEAELTSKGGGEAVSERLKGIHIYERQEDGSWKITHDIWNSDNPPAAGGD